MRDRAAPVDPRAALRIYAYFVPLAFLLYVLDPLGPFFDIAITYILKDHLHVALGDAATFRVLTAIPVYAAVVFGFVRDRWSPFGQYDRGYFLLFAPLLALLMLWLASRPLTYTDLVLGVMAAARASTSRVKSSRRTGTSRITASGSAIFTWGI